MKIFPHEVAISGAPPLPGKNGHDARLVAAQDRTRGGVTVPEAAGGKEIIVIRLPAELVDQRTQDERRIDAAAGQDDIRAEIQRRRDWKRTQVSIDACKLLRNRRFRKHVADVAVTQRVALGG